MDVRPRHDRIIVRRLVDGDGEAYLIMREDEVLAVIDAGGTAQKN